MESKITLIKSVLEHVISGCLRRNSYFSSPEFKTVMFAEQILPSFREVRVEIALLGSSQKSNRQVWIFFKAFNKYEFIYVNLDCEST